MARHALGRPLAPTSTVPRPRRAGVAALLVGATVAAGAAALVPGVAEAAPVPTTPSAAPPKADLGVTVDAPTSVPANQLFVVFTTVTNDGPSTADRVRTTVTLPPGMVSLAQSAPVRDSAGATTYRFDEPGSLAAGESRTYGLLVYAYRTRPIQGSVTASTRSTTLDPALRNNTARARVTTAGADPDTGPVFLPPNPPV